MINLRRWWTAALFHAAVICGAGENLVVNGDFTDGAKGWGGWGNGKAEVKKDAGKDGGNALLIVNPDEKRTVRTQKITPPPGVINVSGYVKAESVNSAEIRLIFYNSAGDQYIAGGEVCAGSVSGSAQDWKLIETNVNVKEGTYFNLWLSVSGAGSAEFSNIKVTAGEKKSGNLLRNSAFKARSNPDLPDYWGIFGGFQFRVPDWDSGRYFSVIKDEKAPEPGADVLKLSGSGEQGMFLCCADYLRGFPGDYTCSIWARSDKDSTPFEFGWIYGGIAGSKQKVSVGKEWKRHSFSFPVAKDGGMSFAVIVPKGETLYITAPQLERGGEMTAWSESLFDKNICAPKTKTTAGQVRAFSIPQTGAPPSLDGRIDDECWKNALKFEDFVDNSSGTPAKIKTEGRICADKENIYLAFRCAEPDMKKLAAEPPKSLYSGDNIEIFIQPGLPGNSYYRLAVSPRKKYDASIGLNGAWNIDAPVIGVSKEADSWTLETAIPLKSLKIGDNTMWGFNFGRLRTDAVSHRDETSVWSGPQGFHNAKMFARAGALAKPNIPAATDFRVFSELSLYPEGVREISVRISGAGDFDTVTTALRDTSGAALYETKPQNPAAENTVRIPSGTLKAGKYEIAAKAFKSGKESASFTDSVYISAGKELVGQNKFLRCLTSNGKPFFPVCFLKEYDSPAAMKDWQYTAIKEKGFNTVIAISRKGNEALKDGNIEAAEKFHREIFDSIAKHGLKIICWAQAGNYSKDMAETLSVAEKIAKMVSRFSDYPGAIGWYIGDEPDKANVSDEALQKYYQTVKKVSPDCPVFINYNWCGISEGALPVGGHDCTDLMFLDVYPFSGWGIDTPLEKYAYHTWLGNKIAAERGRVQLMWLQTYGYWDGLREPNSQEYENMVWQSLIFGTRGIAGFTERPASPSLWEREGVVNSKIQKLSAVMLSEDFKDIAPRKTVSGGVNRALWSADGKYYLLFANPKYEEAPLTLDLKALCAKDFKSAEDIFSGQKLEIKNGILNIQAAPAATGAYALR